MRIHLNTLISRFNTIEQSLKTIIKTYFESGYALHTKMISNLRTKNHWIRKTVRPNSAEL